MFCTYPGTERSLRRSPRTRVISPRLAKWGISILIPIHAVRTISGKPDLVRHRLPLLEPHLSLVAATMVSCRCFCCYQPWIFTKDATFATLKIWHRNLVTEIGNVGIANLSKLRRAAYRENFGCAFVDQIWRIICGELK